MRSIYLGGLAFVMVVWTTDFTNRDHLAFGAGLSSLRTEARHEYYQQRHPVRAIKSRGASPPIRFIL